MLETTPPVTKAVPGRTSFLTTDPSRDSQAARTITPAVVLGPVAPAMTQGVQTRGVRLRAANAASRGESGSASRM